MYEIVYLLRNYEAGNLRGLIEAGVMELERLGEVKVISSKEILPEQGVLQEGEIDLVGYRRIRQQEAWEAEEHRVKQAAEERRKQAIESAKASTNSRKRSPK